MRCYAHIITQQLHFFYLVTLQAIGGFPGDASRKEPACQCRSHKKHGFDTRVGKIPWSEKWQPTPVFLPKKAHGQRSLEDYGPQG